MEALKLIQKHFPHLEQNYTANVKKANKSVLHQLIQAILRERVFPYEWKYNQTKLIIAVNEYELHVPVSKVYILQHIDIRGDIILQTRHGKRTIIETVEDCLRLLFPGNNRPDFYEEVRNSAENYALALTVAEQRRRQIYKDGESTLSFARKQKSPLTFFEQWVIQGHTIHPCSRTRMGLSPEDIATYAPEWAARPEVIPLMVHQDRVHRTSRSGETFKSVLFQDYPKLKTAFQDHCRSYGLDPEDYEILPVHPWQYQHTITSHYKKSLQKKDILPMKDYRISTAALISFRTLAPLNDRKKHHIKTAVNVQMTSAIRTVSAASTKNGPLLSRLFQRIFQDDTPLARKLSIMGEVSGLHYQPDQSKDRHFLQKNAAAILRENPEKDLADGEMAIPGAALLASSPFSEELIVEDLAQQYSSPEAFIAAYSGTVLPGVLTLMTKYGISMEAHLQNCVVIFKEGKPKRAVLRDYGGIRIMNDRLDHFFENQPIDPSTNLLTTDRSELLDIFSHALLHNHLGEIIVALARNTAADEKRMWAEVRKTIEQTYRELKRDQAVLKEALFDMDELFQRPAWMKALVKMRLSNQFTDNLYIDIPSPFQKKKEVSRDDSAIDRSS
ncbi:Siderophore synthetase component [Halobacillus karajensis]|uniref:IucA/IucC family protein n=1 Tax=Halobacillus karajensis TaxID=195088 RepID=UPI0008A7F2E2|nr:IucA/IucC family protein [Halobacillus karajensis]SEH98624.1 Siderophore synthetase component [Halobacillus karajensis]